MIDLTVFVDFRLFGVEFESLFVIGGHSKIFKSFFVPIVPTCLISSGRFSYRENRFFTLSIEVTFNGSAFGFGQYFCWFLFQVMLNFIYTQFIIIYLGYFPYNNRTICTTRNNKFTAWTESTCDNAGRMCDSTHNLNRRLIVP